MFVPRTGRRILFAALALGLVLLPSVTWATTVTIQAPFDSTIATPIPSLSQTHDISIANDGGPVGSTTYFGRLDLQNNDIIFTPSVPNDTNGRALYNKVNDMVRSGILNPTTFASDWSGEGIGSSQANVDFYHYKGRMGVGTLYNNTGFSAGNGIQWWGGTDNQNGNTFDGVNVSQFATIVKYTYMGDTQLRGTVDPTDTASLFANLGTSPQTDTWLKGDFFYADTSGGSIDSSDTAILVANVTDTVPNHLYPHTVSFAQGGAFGGASVPEPSSLALLGLGALSAIGIGVSRGRRLFARAK